MKAYLHSKDMSPGRYDLKIVLNYLDTRIESVSDILLELNRANIRSIGKVTKDVSEGITDEKLKRSLTFNTLLIIILIVTNIFIIFKVIKKNKG